MVEIIPFNGILYNREKVSDIKAVTTPPYDVISAEAREEYYRKHECNIIRIILGKDFPDDNKQNNRYTRAAAFFQKWMGEELLVQDREPSIYIYEHKFLHNGKHKSRTGFIALLKLEDFGKGGVFPHEDTLSKPKEDRLELLRVCRANFSPIFTLYSDPKRVVDKLIEREMRKKPTIDIGSDDGQRHKFWSVSSQDTIKKIRAVLSKKEIYIADGHHRYKAALSFRNEMREKYGGKGGPQPRPQPYDYVMVYMTNMHGRGLTLRPAHRLIRKLPDAAGAIKLDEISEYFKIEPLEHSQREVEKQTGRVLSIMEARGRKKHVFGMYYDKGYYILTLNDGKVLDKFIHGASAEWKKLDVAILHKLLLERVLAHGNRISEEDISYVTDADSAVRMVGEGGYLLALFVNPTKINQVRDVARAGELMPGKATYFYPKPLTGLVINKF
jgi:uncharacterized protein (DUF1015 family)